MSTSNAARESRPSGFVQSLAKGLAVIQAFDADEPELTLSDVARKTGLTRAAARRSLLTLRALGYVGSDGRLFALRPRVLELGYSYLSSIRLPALALPYLEVLVAEVRESCSISVLDDDEIVYIARVPTTRIMTVNINVGTRFPAWATSMGRVLLAAQTPEDRRRLFPTEFVKYTARTTSEPDDLSSILEEVAAQGWAAVDQELEDGLRSIAAPIRDASGRVVAAINLSTHASRVSMDALRNRLLPRLRETVAKIEHDLVRVPALPDITSLKGR